MGVADRDGQRIGAVGGFKVRSGQQRADHHLHLFLGRVAGADNGLLHQVGRVFEDGNPRQGRNQHRDAAGLAELQGRRRVGVDEGFLDRRLGGRHVADDLDQTVVKLHQPGRQIGLGIGRNDAVRDIAKPGAGVFDDAPTGVLQPGIKPDQPHPCSNPFPDILCGPPGVGIKRSAFP